jgi:ribulose bisphosphate carboxylase small subunit
MTVLTFRTSTYARNIYIYGVTSFTTIPAEYVEPVKEYATTHFTKEQIQNAYEKGWITTQEYNDTIALIPQI